MGKNIDDVEGSRVREFALILANGSDWRKFAGISGESFPVTPFDANLERIILLCHPEPSEGSST
jgi:hypothetical protein